MNELWKQYPHMNDPWVLQDPKVSPATIDALSRQSSPERIQQYRDPAYWDMLVFHPDGPQIGHLSPEDKHTIVHEFWTYNLWQNLPDFAASASMCFSLRHWPRAVSLLCLTPRTYCHACPPNPPTEDSIGTAQNLGRKRYMPKATHGDGPFGPPGWVWPFCYGLKSWRE